MRLARKRQEQRPDVQTLSKDIDNTSPHSEKSLNASRDSSNVERGQSRAVREPIEVGVIPGSNLPRIQELGLCLNLHYCIPGLKPRVKKTRQVV